MSYVLTEFQMNSQPLSAVYNHGGGTYLATPVIGFGIFRDMSPDNRGSENVLVPLTAYDFEDGQTLSHDTRADVIDSHAPYQLVTDPELHAAVLKDTWCSVAEDLTSHAWHVVGDAA